MNGGFVNVKRSRSSTEKTITVNNSNSSKKTNTDRSRSGMVSTEKEISDKTINICIKTSKRLPSLVSLSITNLSGIFHKLNTKPIFEFKSLSINTDGGSLSNSVLNIMKKKVFH